MTRFWRSPLGILWLRQRSLQRPGLSDRSRATPPGSLPTLSRLPNYAEPAVEPAGLTASCRPSQRETVASLTAVEDTVRMEIERLVAGQQHDPHSVLGVHPEPGRPARCE